MDSLNYAKLCCDTVMKKFPNGELPPVGIFHYHAGVFLHGMEELYLLTNDKKYDNYIENWLSKHIDEKGNIHEVNDGSLDDLQSCNLLVRYCRQGNAKRGFREALDFAGEKLLSWKTNVHGGLWHKNEHPNQVWLDSVYMGQLLAVRYGLLSGDRTFIDMADKQMNLLWQHARDEKTGLLYHAWDPSIEAEWNPNPKTGCSSEIWGRALGWYFATLTLLGELLTENDPVGKRFLERAKIPAENSIKYQDKEKHMWYQVVDKGENDGNWIETSCSCLYVFALCKLIKIGALKNDEYIKAARNGYNAIIKNYTETDSNTIYLKNVCMGTGVGTYEYYIDRPTAINDLHGMGAFALMCTEYYKAFGE